MIQSRILFYLLLFILSKIVNVSFASSNRVAFCDSAGNWQIGENLNIFRESQTRIRYRIAHLNQEFWIPISKMIYETDPASIGLTQQVYLTEGNMLSAKEHVGTIVFAGKNGLLNIEVQVKNGSDVKVWRHRNEVSNQISFEDAGISQYVYFSHGYPIDLLHQISSYGQLFSAAQSFFKAFEAFGHISFAAASGRIQIVYTDRMGAYREIWKNTREVSREIIIRPKEHFATFLQRSEKGEWEEVSGKAKREGENGRILLHYRNEHGKRKQTWKYKHEFNYIESTRSHPVRRVAFSEPTVTAHHEAQSDLSYEGEGKQLLPEISSTH